MAEKPHARILILRTMAHTRVWEKGISRCYFEPRQLSGMILNWEPNIMNLTVDQCNLALGVYTAKYFQPSRYGRIGFSGQVSETSISLLKLDGANDTRCSCYTNGAKLYFSYLFEQKLWADNNPNRMLSIDNALVALKIAELTQCVGYVPITSYRWPLAFSLDMASVKELLGKIGVALKLPVTK